MISSTASHAGLVDWSAMAAYQKAVREYLSGVSNVAAPAMAHLRPKPRKRNPRVRQALRLGRPRSLIFQQPLVAKRSSPSLPLRQSVLPLRGR
jgi:hypothetical protein